MTVTPMNYFRLLAGMSAADIAREVKKPSALLMDREATRKGELSVAYAPFDHVNREARIVIVGITPGATQMEAGLHAVRSGYLMGLPEEQILERAKTHASFSGDMRSELVTLLDYIGMNRALGIETAADLWGAAGHLAHFTSALRYPTFIDGANYNGTPAVKASPLLSRHAQLWFGSEAKELGEAVFVLLGPKVDEIALPILRSAGVTDDRIISDFCHPSGANRERLRYFTKTLGKEPSAKVDKAKTDANRAVIVAKVAAIAGRWRGMTVV
jgi:hypothetical protein|nr:uracil-DNA glycosylase family protein [Neorhizobium tomejilense]